MPMEALTLEMWKRFSLGKTIGSDFAQPVPESGPVLPVTKGRRQSLSHPAFSHNLAPRRAWARESWYSKRYSKEMQI